MLKSDVSSSDNVNTNGKRSRGQKHFHVDYCCPSDNNESSSRIDTSFFDTFTPVSNKRFKPCNASHRGKVFLPLSNEANENESIYQPSMEDNSQEQDEPSSGGSSTGSSSQSHIEQESHLALSQLLMEGPDRRQSQEDIAKAPIDLAWHFVENVIDRREKIQRSPERSNLITTIAEDELYFLVQNFLACRDSFIEKGLPANVTLAYHYTKQNCVDGIRQHGLIESSNGTYGRGIYLGNNPLAFHGRGNMGLLVAILKGSSTRVNRKSSRNAQVRNSNNTLIGNKLERSNSNAHANAPAFCDEIILQESCQCVPLLRFDASLVDIYGNPSSRGNDILWQHHKEMQRVIDLFFNNGEISKIQKADIFPVPSQLPSIYHPNSSFHRRNVPSRVPLHLIYVSNSINGTWQNDKDKDHRRKMIQDVALLVRECSLNKLLSNDFLNKLPSISKIIEVNLYRSAPSFEAYMDKNTLKQRILEISSKIKNTNRGRSNSPVNVSERLDTPTYTDKIIYNAPKSMDSLLDENQSKLIPSTSHCNDTDCAICLSPMKSDENIVKINVSGCNHVFHRDCAKKALEMKPCCPICRRLVSEPRGTSPSGTMAITTKPFYCAGFENSSNGTIEIKYEMHSNFQKSYHPNPGVFYLGTERIAYLPNNYQGLELLKRLKYAWSRGLTFTVGTSLTTGLENNIVWASIHHKTSLGGGVGRHGFPDGGYFLNCNAELDSLGVPKAIDCK